MKDDRLEKEAKAFDDQIIERINNGHIPDLRLVKPCDYFYNNSWRHPDYVKLDMYDKFETIHNGLKKFLTNNHENNKVLEVGCGPGYLSLELARNGFDVVGIDVSQQCIQVADKFRENDPWIKRRGSLKYINGNFLDDKLFDYEKFDAIVFLGTLHHFADQDNVMERIEGLLKKNGVVVIYEPTRDRVTEGNLVFIHLIKTLLSLNGGYYKDNPIPKDSDTYNIQIRSLLSELTYIDENGEKKQSINDNDAGYSDMYKSLKKYFYELHHENKFAFFREIIGGLRFEEDKNGQLANFLKIVDKRLVELGILQPTEFFYIGRKAT